MHDLILNSSIRKFLKLNYFRINYKSRHTFATQECSLSLHEKERMCASFTKKKREVDKLENCSGNPVKTPTNFAAACCELKIFHLGFSQRIFQV